MDTSGKQTGSQSVLRALHLLKIVGVHHENGISLKSLVEITSLDRATAYRLLCSLTSAGLVARDEKKRYRLGVEAMQLGLKSMSRVPILERCRPLMMRLARRTEDTVYITVRNGDYAHCIHYEEGSYPIKALVLQVDGMRLLGTGSAGTALLATLEEPEILEFHRRQWQELAPQRANLTSLLAEIHRIRECGFASTDNLVAEGVSGIGVPFKVTPTSFASISIGAVRSRMSPERKLWIADVIQTELKATGWQLAFEPK